MHRPSVREGGDLLSPGPGIRDAAVVLGGRNVHAAAYAKAHGYTPFRGVETLRAPDADEDHVTLALTALRRLLAVHDPSHVGQLLFVGAFDEEDAAVVLEALGEPDWAVSFFRDTATAGADALLMALNGPAEPATLLIAADDARSASPGSPRGAGAVALWLDHDAPVRLEVEAHRRRHGGYELSVALDEVFADSLDDGTAPLAAVEDVPGTAARALRQYAGRLVPSTMPRTGNLGAAAALHALLDGLAAPQAEAGLVWVVPGEGGAVVARFGGRLTPTCGVAEALAAPSLDTGPGVVARSLRAWDDARLAVAQGAYVSRQAYLGQTPARYRLEGQTCTTCRHTVFPPRECCPVCATDALAPQPLSGRGTVYALTRIAAGGGPTEFDPLQKATGGYHVAIVELEEGPRVAAMLAGPAVDSLSIGDPVEMTLRLLYVQEGMRRYGFKARVPEPTTPQAQENL